MIKIEGVDNTVCADMVNLMGASALSALGDGVFSEQRVCDELLGVCKSPKIKELDVNDYVKRVLSTKPASL